MTNITAVLYPFSVPKIGGGRSQSFITVGRVPARWGVTVKRQHEDERCKEVRWHVGRLEKKNLTQKLEHK